MFQSIKKYYFLNSPDFGIGGVSVSSQLLPSEKLPKIFWHIHLKTEARIKDLVEEEARREDRSCSYIVSRILERYYEEKSGLKVI
jgi:hypothetical protein